MYKELEPRYNHLTNEPEIYKQWEESGYFNPDNLPASLVSDDTEPFTIVMPPPNANGNLHAGHALVMTLEDIMTRFWRMRGKKALWIPGADHAGFETQVVYEKKLDKEGRSRFDLSREDLYKEILEFTLANKKVMEGQIRALGASCDWSREKFTLDDYVIRETQRTFKKMFDDGLLYRGKRIINWCPRHQTSLSDLETIFKERKDPLYYLKYGPFVIATARPETKFGDKYVVMHPDDPRYAEYKDGQTFEAEWINGPVMATVIKDNSIDMAFGTGVMTITPWHDQADFEIAARHKLEKEQIIDFKDKLLPIADEFAGLHIDKARPLIVEKLKGKGLVEKVDADYVHNVRVCYKCETTIAPQIMDQWFVTMQPLAALALKAADEKKIDFVPDRFEKIFRYWMENTIDWNISRQIVWGIPIPAKLCNSCEQGFPDLDDSIAACPSCGGTVRPDTDTFDTWFSSGQWPLLTLGYPDGQDFKKFYPTSVMESGYDLIFKWIPRMVIFGLYLAKEVPFHTVYLHGLVNDEHGKKMSKSKGNVVNPLDIVQNYGADALRIGLVVGNAPGSDSALSDDKIKGYRNFSTKIWNMARFILLNYVEAANDGEPAFSEEDARNLAELKEVKAQITKYIEEHNFHLAAETVYHYVWHTFADKIIEAAKPRLQGTDENDKRAAYQTLETIMLESLKMLHPFMPFITETVYQKFRPGKLLMVEKW